MQLSRLIIMHHMRNKKIILSNEVWRLDNPNQQLSFELFAMSECFWSMSVNILNFPKNLISNILIQFFKKRKENNASNFFVGTHISPKKCEVFSYYSNLDLLFLLVSRSFILPFPRNLRLEAKQANSR